MVDAPRLPKGIERDDTVHGRLYFTRPQMIEYGAACAASAMGELIESGKEHVSSGQKQDDTVDLLRGFMGMKK